LKIAGLGQNFSGPGHQPEVLGEPAVEDVDVGAIWVLVGLERVGAEQGTARRLRIGAGGLGCGLPIRRLPTAGSSAVLQSDGR
jgi:hypothetical protein